MIAWKLKGTMWLCFFFQAEDGIRDLTVTGVQTCALPISQHLNEIGIRRKVRRYQGTKEDVYLADFAPDPDFVEVLRQLGVRGEDVLVVARPPAREALYHRFENELFDELLNHLRTRAEVKILLLPRTEAQR